MTTKASLFNLILWISWHRTSSRCVLWPSDRCLFIISLFADWFILDYIVILLHRRQPIAFISWVIWNHAIIIFQSLKYAIGISMTYRTHMSQWHVGQDGISQILQNYNGMVPIFPYIIIYIGHRADCLNPIAIGWYRHRLLSVSAGTTPLACQPIGCFDLLFAYLVSCRIKLTGTLASHQSLDLHWS